MPLVTFFAPKLLLCVGLLLPALPAFGGTISFVYKYDTVDGGGGTAILPRAGGSHRDKQHLTNTGNDYSLFANGNLNDGTKLVGTAAGTHYDLDANNSVLTQDENHAAPHDAQPAIILDLGDLYQVDGISVFYEVMHQQDIGAPSQFDVFISNSLAVWGSATTFSGFSNADPDDGNSEGYEASMGFPGIGRYIRIDVRQDESVTAAFPPTGAEWTALTEIEVSGDTTPIPEPSTLALCSLLGLAGIGVRHWRRRRRR